MKKLLRKIIKRIEKELDKVLKKISEKQTSELIKLIKTSKTIFLAGQGRSGLVAQAFAMRLTHLGLNSHIIGEATAPSIKKNNLLIAISGSGKTKQTIATIKNAKKARAKICLITSKQPKIKPDLIIKIEAKTKFNHKKSIEPLGSLFEQATLLYLDSVVILLMKKLKIKEKAMKKRHSK